MTKETLLSSVKSGSIITDVFMENPNRFMPLLSFAQNILREDSFLSSEDRESIAAFTSSLNNCKFCTGSHKVFALSVGANEEDLNKILSQKYSDLKLAPILDYVKKLTLTPSELKPEDVKKVKDAGYSEDELKDAITVCAAFNMFNRIVEGHGVEENSHTWNMSADMINKYGYDRGKSQE
jgi:uncharacterized peroxidase-related enzyme